MNESSSSPQPGPQPSLVRGLGVFMAMAVVVGCVIGSGIFRKPQTIAEQLPRFDMVALVWIAGGVLALLGSLTLAEIAVLFPVAGGNYIYLREGYGRWAGFLWGWVEFLIIKTASQAALATMFTEAFHDLLKQTIGSGQGSILLPYWEEKAVTVTVIALPVFVNIRGVRWGGGLQLAITLVKVGSLLMIMLLPWVIMAMSRLPQMPEPAEPFQPHDITFSNFLTALLGVLFAYHGWMNLAPVAGEITNPQRNIPIALVGGVILVVILYLGANVAYYQVLPAWEIPTIKGTPVANIFSTRLLGSAGGIAMSLAIMFSTFGALNGNLLTCPRLLYAMGEDGLAPRALGAVHPRFHTPAVAILVMGAWTIALLLAVAILARLEVIDPNKNQFDRLTDFAMFGAVIFETMALSTIFVFRRTMPDAPRSYRCWGYPVVPALYMILPLLVAGNTFYTPELRLEASVGVGFILVGALVYAVICRSKYSSRSV